jgi:hypothetical protein
MIAALLPFCCDSNVVVRSDSNPVTRWRDLEAHLITEPNGPDIKRVADSFCSPRL